MCRHLAYLGPPIALARLLFEPAHGLVHQAWAPRDMRGGGTINADGFGVGWFAGAEPAGSPAAQPVVELAAQPVGEPIDEPAAPQVAESVRYRRDCPIWADPFLPELARTTTAPAVVAAVRSATAGMPLVATACAPFTGDGWLFSLNGRIAGWPESVAALARRLPVTDLLTMEAPVDSALLWALVRDRLRAGAGPVEAVAETVAEVAAAAPGSRLNLLLANPTTIIATTLTHALAVRSAAGSVLVSSEPLDDHPAWRPLPDGVLVVATVDGVDVTKMGDPR
ncbi:MAG TPA: ergothioneine biosynthesis protein EgtC [Natronosporangium sp.]